MLSYDEIEHERDIAKLRATARELKRALEQRDEVAANQSQALARYGDREATNRLAREEHERYASEAKARPRIKIEKLHLLFQTHVPIETLLEVCSGTSRQSIERWRDQGLLEALKPKGRYTYNVLDFLRLCELDTRMLPAAEDVTEQDAVDGDWLPQTDAAAAADYLRKERA